MAATPIGIASSMTGFQPIMLADDDLPSIFLRPIDTSSPTPTFGLRSRSVIARSADDESTLYISQKLFAELMFKIWGKNNKNEIIPEDIALDLRNKLENLIDRTTPGELLKLLKIISKNINCFSKFYFSVVLDELMCKFPYLTEYLDLETEYILLTPKAVLEIIKFFEKKYKFERGLLTCNGSDELPRLIEEVITSPNDVNYHAAIIYPSSGGSHFSPVFIQKKKGKVQILISDSIGNLCYPLTAGEVRGCIAFKEVVKFLNENVSKYPGLKFEVYSLDTKRQREIGSCSLYALLDTKNILKNIEKRDVFDFTIVNGNITRIKDGVDPTISVYKFENLPPDMMRETQSLNQIGDYTGTISPRFTPFSPVPDDEEVERFHKLEEHRIHKDVRTLTRDVEDLTRLNPDGKRLNRTMDKEMLEMITRICIQVLDL